MNFLCVVRQDIWKAGDLVDSCMFLEVCLHGKEHEKPLDCGSPQQLTACEEAATRDRGCSAACACLEEDLNCR